MFLDFGKTPNLKAALKTEVEPEQFRLQLVSQPLMVQGYKWIAVKVVQVYANGSTVVREIRRCPTACIWTRQSSEPCSMKRIRSG
jgi:hypothetical protein